MHRPFSLDFSCLVNLFLLPSRSPLIKAAFVCWRAIETRPEKPLPWVVVMADSDNEQQPAATATEEDDEHGFKSSGGKGYVEPGSNVVMVSLDDEEQTTNQFTYSKWRLVPMREKTADNVTSL